MSGRIGGTEQVTGALAWTNTEFLVPRDKEQGRAPCGSPGRFCIVTTRDIGRIAPMVHEVKVSRADFLADVAKPDKRAGYGVLAGAVY